MTLLDNPALKLYALVSSILAVWLILIAFWTARTRAARKVFVNAEDAVTFQGKDAEVEHPDVARAKRAHTNALENAVPFFAVGLLYALTGPGMGLAQGLFYTFLGARILHTVVYLAGKQPFRTLLFVICALCTIVMAVQVIRAVV